MKMDKSVPLASIIILGYNGRPFLDGCLGSVLDQDVSRTLYEVLYIDNGSTDGSVEYVKSKFPEIRSIPLGRNLGYARGNNEAIRYAAGRYLVFLNQDTVVHRSWLRALVETVASDARLGACHANMIMPWHEEFEPMDRTGYPRHVYVTEINRYGFAEYYQLPMPQEPFRTRFLSGACFVIDRQLLPQLGYLFDPRFFMYAEDLDLALRIQTLGYEIALAPQAVVYHLHDASQRPRISDLSIAFRATRNRILAFYKVSGGKAFFLRLPWILLGAPLKVFQVGTNRCFQGLAFLGMIPVTLLALLAALANMPYYRRERSYWLHHRLTNPLGEGVRREKSPFKQ